MKMSQWPWIPATVFLLGILSAIMLLSVNRISERQRFDFDLVETIMDVQINTATAHLWLEHVVSGAEEVEAGKVIADLDQAMKLVDVILKGGEHDRHSESFNDRSVLNRAEEVKSLLIALKMGSFERIRSPKTSGMGTLVDHRFNALFENVLGKARALEGIVKKDVEENEKKFNRLFLAILVVWLSIVAGATTSLFVLERQRRKNRTALVKTNAQLHLQADELVAHRERLEELVSIRTAELQGANVRIQAEMAERLHACGILHEAEKRNRDLAYRLLSVQEIERKRISMDLHDGLGQALNVMKMSLRVIGKGVEVGQDAICLECEKLREYLDQAIEEIRRISMDLSPAILEQFGLKCALQRLLASLAKDFHTTMSADLGEIEPLFEETSWIVIYRVVQEAMTNIVKHAQAENVSLLVRRQDQRVVFSVADDGKGFDPEHIVASEAAGKGLGLTTMRERIKILEGDFEVWSRKGRGTRITFSLPVKTGEV